MRGLCALIVAVHHFDATVQTGHLFNHGWLSVDVFFVLSGFVIALVYEGRLRAGPCFSTFLRARAKRLIPTQTIGTLVGATSVLALYLHGDMAAIRGFGPWALTVATIYALFLLPIDLSPVAGTFAYWREMFPINPPIWSLQGEWVINVIYGRMLYAMKTGTLVAVSLIPAAYLLYLIFNSGAGWDGMLPGIARAVTGFVAGIVIFRVQEFRAFRRLPIVRPEIIFAIWFFICSVPRTGTQPIFEAAAAMFIAPVLVALLVRGDRPLARPWLILGRLSYPLYASHFAIVNFTNVFLSATGWRHRPLLLAPMIAAALMLAWAIDWAVARFQYSGVTVAPSSSKATANSLGVMEKAKSPTNG
jgi:peptidoglycan/LPS O-acetylase OafA/YrhL